MSLRAAFERSYFPPTGTPWPPLTWRGVPCQKLATDLWALGEIVWQMCPGLIIETGTAAGGTALFLADLLDHLPGRWGVVWTVDPGGTAHELVRQHYSIEYRCGSSLSPAMVADARRAMQDWAPDDAPVLVILDSDHHAAHVAAELAAYAPLVTPGSYCIVEDTNLGDTVMPEHGPGPAVAVADYLATHPGMFAVDREREPPITTQPGGWLRRLA